MPRTVARATIGLVIFSIGCGGQVESAKGAPIAPDVSVKPSGDGWACFQNRNPDFMLSMCARPDSCDQMRDITAEQFTKQGLPHDLTPCVARASAACLTMRAQVGSSSVFPICAETMIDCERVRDVYRSQPSLFSDVTDCATW